MKSGVSMPWPGFLAAIEARTNSASSASLRAAAQERSRVPFDG